MRVHHLNCGTMAPLGGRLVDGIGSPFRTARLVCHCVLVETANGLVLIDTGFGLASIARRRELLGERFLLLTRPRLVPAETAAQQVVRLGYAVRDVRHIVLTHLDIDHASGLADFPEAQVHVHADELAAARNPMTALERDRYRDATWAHGPHWVEHQTGGDRWFGFESVRELPGLPPELLLVPLTGHTRGHVGVAIEAAADSDSRRDAETGTTPDGGSADRGRRRWLLHAGDAYFFRGQVDPVRPYCTPVLTLFQSLVQTEKASRLRNVERLRELAASGEVQVFSAHDPAELARAQASGNAAAEPIRPAGPAPEE